MSDDLKTRRKFFKELHHQNLQVGEMTASGEEVGQTLLNYYLTEKWPRNQRALQAYRERQKRAKVAKARTGFENRHKHRRKKKMAKTKIPTQTVDLKVDTVEPPALMSPSILNDLQDLPLENRYFFDDLHLFDPLNDLSLPFALSPVAAELPNWAINSDPQDDPRGEEVS
jgi:hypothetical protein